VRRNRGIERQGELKIASGKVRQRERKKEIEGRKRWRGAERYRGN